MALTIDTKCRYEAKDAVGQVHFGGKGPHELPIRISAGDGTIHKQTHSVASAANAKIFDVDEDLSDFDYLCIIPEAAGFLELIVDDDGNNGELYLSVPTVANFPFILPGNGSLAGDGTAGNFDGTADFIETIRWKNTSSATALVHIFAAS